MGAGTKSRIRLRRGVVLGVIAGAGLLAIGGASMLLLGSHQAPTPLTLRTPVAGSSQSSLAGTWKVATGSEAGYRVKEKFINQPATTEAVARTPKIAGSLVVASSGSELIATKIRFTADLTALVSQDRYANYQVYQLVAQVQVQPSGNQIEIAGSINIDMRDFAIAPPDISFTTAEPQAVIEFDIFLDKA